MFLNVHWQTAALAVSVLSVTTFMLSCGVVE